MDVGTWETTFAKLPKYIQVTCAFAYIGKRLPSATQKHFELPWVADQQYNPNILLVTSKSESSILPHHYEPALNAFIPLNTSNYTAATLNQNSSYDTKYMIYIFNPISFDCHHLYHLFYRSLYAN